MIRSHNDATFEEGYHAIQFHLAEHLDELISLLLSEANPNMRSRLVELLGDSNDQRAIPILRNELAHPEREVRMWAYQALRFMPQSEAADIVKEFAQQHSGEDFLEK